MKGLIKLNNKFTESEEIKDNYFSSSLNFDFACIHFNIYECLKWLQKPLWLIFIKFCDIADMFHKYNSRSPKVFCKNGVHDSFAKLTRSHLCRSLLRIKKVAGYWLIKKRLRHKCFPVNCAKFLITPILKSFCKELRIMTQNNTIIIRDKKR